MQVEGQPQADLYGGLRSGGRRAYMKLEPGGPSLKDEKQTQTEFGMLATGKTHFVTPRMVLGSEDTADSPFDAAFVELCKRIRSPVWKPSLLIVLGHDPEKRRDDLERKIREDEAAEAIDAELRAFFDTVLAPMMQVRETSLVNTIHECVQQEMQSQQLVIQNQQQRMNQLTQQIEEWEKQVVHLKAKVDRRVAENNALRKEQYRQLLMLRDIMSKQGTEPGALSALNEAIASVLAGKQQTLTPEATQSNNDQDPSKAPGRGWIALNANAQVLHREKEKWEQRAREATLECQALQDKIARLTQENLTYRASEAMPWFLKPQNAIAERQRIADAVCSYQSNWEDIGDALVELLNNDILWAAVEQSARRGGKRRIARGLEAVISQLDNWAQPPFIEEEALSKKSEEATFPHLDRRRSTFAELGRLIPCRACNGVGYIHADRSDNGINDADSYLRKTLEQVLDLKTQLEKANTKSLTLEGQLQLSHMHAAKLQEQIQQAEIIKASAVDSCLQTDLDDEEGLDHDEILRSAYSRETLSADVSQDPPRRNRRNTQYEHLIVELKSTLADKDEGLADSRKALDVAQARIATLQRALQKEKGAHAYELAMLKTSLAFSLKTRNSKIEERQAAVKHLMKKLSKKAQEEAKPANVDSLPRMDETESEASDLEDQEDINKSTLQETNSGEQSSNQEVKRMEALAQRYADDINRVQKEHETQQELLRKAEAEIAEEDEKRSRTNSISQGSLVVSLASHPRDLFKALSTAQGDILKLRRASQRSSALQTDRLLTLTTHLSHMSEEMCTLRKRNLAELEFWKLECEKLQNTNKALEAEQQIARKQLQEARFENEFNDSSSGNCSICENHKKRLLQLSNELLKQAQTPRTDPEVEVPAPAMLTESERNLVSGVLLDLESICSGMPAARQKVARELVYSHLRGTASPRSTRRTTLDNSRSEFKVIRSNNQGGKDGGSPVFPRSANTSPRKTFADAKFSMSSRQLRNPAGTVPHGKQKPSQTSSQVSEVPETFSVTESVAGVIRDKEPSPPEADEFEGRHRKTLVQEILEGGGFSLTKHGFTTDTPTFNVPDMNTRSEDNAESEVDNNIAATPTCPVPLKPCDEEDSKALTSEDEVALVLRVDSPPFEIERDPGVICQLTRLINQTAVANEHFTIARWKGLVYRFLYLSGEQRLNQLMIISSKRSKINTDGSLRPISHKTTSICNAMEQVVQQYKTASEAASSAQDISRRDFNKAKAYLIHGVTMLLDNLSRDGKPRVDRNELLYQGEIESPRRSPTTNRPLYPSTKVHLNRLPQTQQIPTSTFPSLFGPHSADVRPSSPRCSGERSIEHTSNNVGSFLPHRLIKSAGISPFHLVHSSIGALQGSMPFPDPVHIRSLHESEVRARAHTIIGQTRPTRPHSSPAGPRLMSPRSHDLMPSATLLRRSRQITELSNGEKQGLLNK